MTLSTSMTVGVNPLFLVAVVVVFGIFGFGAVVKA